MPLAITGWVLECSGSSRALRLQEIQKIRNAGFHRSLTYEFGSEAAAREESNRIFKACGVSTNVVAKRRYVVM